jgi:mRNA interferase RelE/StbE
MRVVLTPPARKSLWRLPADRQRQIMSRIHAAAAVRAGDIKRLAGSDLFRSRVGDYRVLFALDPANQVMTVELIRTRGDVYKR